MYVTALTRWAAPLESELVPLAQALGEQPYDLRMKLTGMPPLIVYRGLDPDQARHVLAAIQARGHGAVAMDAGRLAQDAALFVAKRVAIGADALQIEQGTQQIQLPFNALLAIVHALHTHETDSLRTQKQSKLSVGRAVVTGGLAWRKEVSKEVSEQSQDAEQVIYLFRRDQGVTAVLRQNTRVEGLPGPAVTSLEVLRQLIAVLQRRAPSALYDNRLLTHKRRPTIVGQLANAQMRVTNHSNASENDLAAHVIALAHLKGQL